MSIGDIITLTCGECERDMELQDANSIWKAKNVPYTVYHGDCYKRMKQREQEQEQESEKQ